MGKKKKVLNAEEQHTKKLTKRRTSKVPGHKKRSPEQDPQKRVEADCPDRWRMDGSGGRFQSDAAPGTAAEDNG